MNILYRNLFRLLRSGAFGEYEDAEPMSAFKWKRIIQMGEAQDVLPYIANGFRKHQDDPHVVVTESLQSELERIIATPLPDLDQCISQMMETEPELNNFYLKRKLRRIIKKDEESPTPSIETQQCLLMMVCNVNQTLTKGVAIKGIIDLGRFLHQRGERVDYVRLERWLHKIGMMRMASFFGTILIHYFHFTIEELPFMNKEESAAVALTQRYLANVAFDTAENWHFRMRTNGMVENNSRVLRRNLRRSMRYLRYNPFETTSNFLANFARSLSEIEE